MIRFFTMATATAASALALSACSPPTKDLTTENTYCAKTRAGSLILTEDGGKTFNYLNPAAATRDPSQGNWAVGSNAKGATCTTTDLALEYSLKAFPKGAELKERVEVEGYHRQGGKLVPNI